MLVERSKHELWAVEIKSSMRVDETALRAVDVLTSAVTDTATADINIPPSWFDMFI